MTARALPRGDRMGYRDMFAAGRLILGLLEDRAPRYAVGLACGVLAGALTWVVPLLVRELFLPLDGRTATLSTEAALLLLAGVHVLRGILRHAGVQVTSVIGYDVARRARLRLYEHLARLSLGFLARSRTGSLMARAMGDCETFEMFLYRTVPVALTGVTVPVGMAIILLVLDLPLGLIAVVFAPISAALLLGFSSEIRKRYRVHRERYAEISAQFHESITALPVIKSFHRERETLSRIRDKAERYRDSVLWVLRVGGLPMALSEGTATLAIAIIVFVGAQRVLAGALGLADLFVFLLFTLYFYEPIREINQVAGRFQNAVNGAQRVFGLLDQRPDVVDAPDAIDPGRVAGDIELDRVTFAYEPGREAVRDVSIRVRAGEVVALVGPSGSGKTTLAHLLSRFYDPDRGQVRVGGTDLRRIAQSALHRSIASVMQDVFLFDDTVRENIRLGRPDASDEEVERAARAANVHELIAGLPEGYDTPVGERGVRFSGGEKQRISVARAILKDAPILVLDEATSSVDTESEALIQEALARLTAGRTVVVIAHRLSTVRRADRIVVLERGAVVEEGRHDELMARGGRYAAAWLAQQRARDWRIGTAGA